MQEWAQLLECYFPVQKRLAHDGRLHPGLVKGMQIPGITNTSGRLDFQLRVTRQALGIQLQVWTCHRSVPIDIGAQHMYQSCLGEKIQRLPEALAGLPGPAVTGKSGLAIGVESECAAAAVVGARLGLEMGALLFCSDNVTLPTDDDKLYGGLKNPATRRGFEAGAAALVETLVNSEF